MIAEGLDDPGPVIEGVREHSARDHGSGIEQELELGQFVENPETTRDVADGVARVWPEPKLRAVFERFVTGRSQPIGDKFSTRTRPVQKAVADL